MTRMTTIIAALAFMLSMGFAGAAAAAPEGFNNFDGGACYCVDP